MRIQLTIATLALIGGVAHAQGAPLDGRVGKLEKEMKAVQRKVFPQGAPVDPEIAAAPVAAAGSPADTPVADLTTRVDALERSVAAVTGQVEEQGNRLRLAEDAIKRLQSPGAGDPGAETVSGPVAGVVTTPEPTTVEPPPVAKPASVPRSDADRRKLVSAIEMPDTGDAGEDAYTYGFRLYAGKLYPEAQATLKAFANKYPKHRRASFAQNLLGRAYLDEGKPALASVAFYDNYEKNPKGERAPESLARLGEALIRLKKLPDACKVFDELDEVYATRLTPDLKAKAQQGRVDATCAR